MTIFKFKYILSVSLCLCAWFSNGQITAGKITFERKTNLLKKFKDPKIVQWLGDNNKTKIDMFDLYFNDSMSLFIPTDLYAKDDLSWATNKNTTYQNINQKSRFSIINVWGENLYIQDSTVKRTWKITDSKRTIGKYECRKAIWQVNDSVRIYAWYSDDIVPSVGPETFTGLPGAILGVATEDGGVIYFAKSVEIMTPDFNALAPKVGKNKTATAKELRTQLEKQFSSRPEMIGYIADIFMW